MSNAPFQAPHMYNSGTDSTVGKNLKLFHLIDDKILTSLEKVRYFTQLADVVTMPKHRGKTIKMEKMYPLIDDRNVNNQGINLLGLDIKDSVTIVIRTNRGVLAHAVGSGVDAVSALTNAEHIAMSIFKDFGVFTIDYSTTVTAVTAKGWTVTELPAINGSGNLTGSSRNIADIVGKFPAVGEVGGRVNRVGFTKASISGNIERFGFFYEMTIDSLNFDTITDLAVRMRREALKAANELVEKQVQIDLLNGATTILFGGEAFARDELTGEGAVTSNITYDLFERMEQALNRARTPKDTTIITGSVMTDTQVLGATRYVYVGSELIKSLKLVLDYHGKPAFIPVQSYGAAGTIAKGEIGSIAGFRIIEVPEMLHHAAAGAAVSNNANHFKESDGHYDVFPMLFVGSGSFSAIGFQTDGKTHKFDIITRMPGEVIGSGDPYERTGYISIAWWYGSLIQWSEWIGLIEVVAHN